MNDKKSATPDVEIGHGAVILRCGGSETVVTKDGVKIQERWKFDHHELPLLQGGYRAGLTSGIAKYLGIPFELAGDARERAMLAYPEAFCRLVRACAEEARAMMAEGVEPFTAAVDQREKGSGQSET